MFTLVAADEVTVNSTLDKMAKTSRELLTRVATEHRGTPWADDRRAGIERPDRLALERKLRPAAGAEAEFVGPRR